MDFKVVETTLGKIKGMPLDVDGCKMMQFRGIPYAKPPVGNLRWRAPESPEPWEGVRDCTVFGFSPVQIPFNGDGMSEELQMSEDCLYLNITTPVTETETLEKLPVFVWMHGGGLTKGSASSEMSNPVELVKEGIVVVSIGQRLNLFGCLALPQLSAEQGGVSGNYILMDELLALKWITDNIAKFGGDPECITVGGSSGGTYKTSVLAAIPASRGRIRRVINMSGLRWVSNLSTVKEAEAKGIAYLEAVGIDPAISVEELRAMDTYEIFKNVPESTMPGFMVYDEKLVPLQLRECCDRFLANTDYINVSTSGEGDVFAVSHYIQGGNARRTETREEFYEHFREILGELYEKYDFERIMPVTDENAAFWSGRLASMGLTKRGRVNDCRSLMVNRLFGMYMKKLYPENKNYACFFSRAMAPVKGSGKARDILAPHGSDGAYCFAGMKHGRENREWTQDDVEFAETYCHMIANFIKTGNPNEEGYPYWPEAGDNYGYIEAGDEIRAMASASPELDALIREFTMKEYQIMLD